MTSRERLERALGGDTLDRVPVSLWRYWQGDDQRAADLAKSLIQFQRQYDWDLCVLAPAPYFSVTGYGLQEDWGVGEGTRTVLKRPVERTLDWTELRPLDALRGDIGRQLECVRLVGDAFATEQTPFIQVVYSPFTQAMSLAGDKLLRHIRTQPDRFQTGMNAITETTLRFVEALRKSAVAGIYYVMDGAHHDFLSEVEYDTFGLPYDRKILEALSPKWWCNIVAIRGDSPMLGLCANLPVQGFSWNATPSGVPLDRGKLLISGAIMGGLSTTELVYGTPLSIREAVRHALTLTNGRRFILSSDSFYSTNTPASNIQAVRDSVKTVVS